MEKHWELAERNQAAAWRLLRELEVMEAWEAVEAKVNLVGSLRTGLLTRHLDIDLHVYTRSPAVEAGFAAMGRIARHPGVLRISYSNGMETEERCLEWHCFCKDREDREWQLDIIQIEPGSLYDGHFERVAERILASLTPERKDTILRLKYQTPEGENIPGIEYCRAVLGGGVRSWEEFAVWRAACRGMNLMDWLPD